MKPEPVRNNRGFIVLILDILFVIIGIIIIASNLLGNREILTAMMRR